MKQIFTLLFVLCTVTGKAQTIDGHEYVDLGLPSGTLWATCNVGATELSGYGDFYAWGEIECKGDYVNYSLKNYKFYQSKDTTYIDRDGFTINKTISGYTKYVTTANSGYNAFCDNKIELDLEDDVACIAWGEGWRIPKHEDWVELNNECTWTQASINGINGYKVVGPNSQYIFLPACGEWDDIFGAIFKRDCCEYWASDILQYLGGNYDSSSAWTSDMDSGRSRYYGLCVRPVSYNSTSIESVNTNSTSTTTEIYNVKGELLTDQQPGINIVKYSDGTTKKIIIK